MAQYEITQRCSVGNIGEVIDVDGELTARQSVYLKPVNPKIEVVSNAELEALKAENESLKAELEALKAGGEVATPTKSRATKAKEAPKK